MPLATDSVYGSYTNQVGRNEGLFRLGNSHFPRCQRLVERFCGINEKTWIFKFSTIGTKNAQCATCAFSCYARYLQIWSHTEKKTTKRPKLSLVGRMNEDFSSYYYTSVAVLGRIEAYSVQVQVKIEFATETFLSFALFSIASVIAHPRNEIWGHQTPPLWVFSSMQLLQCQQKSVGKIETRARQRAWEAISYYGTRFGVC